MAPTNLSDVSSTSVNEQELLILAYHDDIKLAQSPLIYRGMDSEPDMMDSRRLLFYNLPPSITALQVARATAAFGQVLRIEPVAPVVRGAGDGTITMLVEFATSRSTDVCRAAVNSTCTTIVTHTGERYVAGIWVIPTPSFAVCAGTSLALTKGYTRSIFITPVYEPCVWFMICAVAVSRDILDAEYDGATKTLTLEFATVELAYRVANNFNRGLFDFLFNSETDEKRVGICVDRVRYGGYTAYLPPDYLHQQYDCPPFNDYWPTTYYYVMTQRNLHPRGHAKKRNTSSSDETTTDGHYNDTASSAGTSLDDEPRGRSLLTREVLGSKTQKQGPKYLLDGEEDPVMTGNWDQFSQNGQSISLRGWIEYGKIARHRRELSIEQATAAGIVPKCDGDCELECKDIKETPRPAVVDKFLATPQEDFLIEL
ncbi:hypothetical protein PWT90_08097 [Aphanocladium album]|nr:hypothetical protein PWT90_08097 [Aphanocladium album]